MLSEAWNEIKYSSLDNRNIMIRDYCHNFLEPDISDAYLVNWIKRRYLTKWALV